MASSSNKPSKLDASFSADDVRVVADLFATFTEGDSEKLLSRVLFDEFGRQLEEKFNQFQASKDELKDSIRRNFGENLVPKTPRRHKPAALLLERIQRFKMVSFMSEEHSLTDSVVEEETRGIEKEIVVTERVLLKPAATSATGAIQPLGTRRGGKPPIVERTVASSAKPRKGGGKKVWQQQAGNSSTPVSSQVASSHEKRLPSTTGTPLAPSTFAVTADAPADAVDPYRMEEGLDDGIEVGMSAKSSQQKGRKKKRVPFTPVEKPQASVFAIKKGIRSTVRPLVSQSGAKRVRSSSAAARKKSQQLRKLEEKAQLALKHKEELLKDKAERAKRDREERRLRVEQNNRVKEAEQKEREHQMRAQEERLREFRLEQERAAQQPGAAKSPGHPTAHQLHHPQHPNLNRVPSTASSTSSTAKSQQTSSAAAAIITVAEKTPNSKQPPHGSVARPVFPKPVVFRSGLTLSSQKAVAQAKALAAASPSAIKHPQPRPIPLSVATPPPKAVTPIGARPVQSKLIASAAGSTTPYPHRIDTGDGHEQRRDEEISDGAARPKSTPKLVTPRQIAVPPKKSSQETAVTATGKTIAVVEPPPKRKPALTARQREAEKLKLEKEMKAVREREEALRQYQRLEEERKKREEEHRRRVAEEEERLASDRAARQVDQEELEKRRIREAVEQAERELAKKREALLAASSANAAANAPAEHKNSPFLPPGLPKSVAHVSVVESVEGESTQDAEEIMVVSTVQKQEIIVREVEVEKSYDGSISDDLTSSITEMSPPTSANNVKPAMAPQKWPPNGKDGRDKENKNVCASGSGKANILPHKFPAPSVLKPAAMKQVLNQSTYDMTPDKVFLPSTQDNYNVDDLSSNDETDNEDHPRKDVPKWAQRTYLIREQAILRRLLTSQQIAHHFGRIRFPRPDEIFPQVRRNFNDHSIPLAWSSPLSDPTPGEAQFLLFQTGLNANADR